MWVPEIAGLAPVPGWVLVADIHGHKALVLENERNPDEIGKQARADQAGLEVVGDNKRRGDSGIGIGPRDPHRMVVIPQEPGALFHGVVVVCRAPWRTGAGHV